MMEIWVLDFDNQINLWKHVTHSVTLQEMSQLITEMFVFFKNILHFVSFTFCALESPTQQLGVYLKLNT